MKHNSSQSPAASCNLELLHEILDTIIRSLWINPSGKDAHSLFNVNKKPNEKFNPTQFPPIQESAGIKSYLKELKAIVGFLHLKLNERAETIKFEWEESLAFASTLVTRKPSAPSALSGLTHGNQFASYLTGSSALKSREHVHTDSDLSSNSPMSSPLELFDELLHLTDKADHRCSSASSVSSISGSIHGGEPVQSGVTHNMAQNFHQNSHLTSPLHQSSSSIANGYNSANISPVQSRRRSLIPRPSSSRNSLIYASSPPPSLPPLPLPLPLLVSKSAEARHLSPQSTQTQNPGYLGSTASSRAFSRARNRSPTGDSTGPPRLLRAPTPSLGGGGPPLSRNLRHRNSMPAIHSNRPATQLSNYPSQQQFKKHLQQEQQSQYQQRPGSALYALPEGLYQNHGYSTSSNNSILRRMSSTSVLKDSYSTPHRPSPLVSPQEASIHMPRPVHGSNCICHELNEQLELSDRLGEQEILDIKEEGQFQSQFHQSGCGGGSYGKHATAPRQFYDPLQSSVNKSPMHVNLKYSVVSPLRYSYSSQLRDSSPLSTIRTRSPGIRVVSDPTLVKRSASVCYSYRDTFWAKCFCWFAISFCFHRTWCKYPFNF